MACRVARAVLAACLLAIAVPAAAQTQQPQASAAPTLLFVDPEAVLQSSAAGQEVLREIERDRAALLAETEALSQAFEQEERELTELRETMTREEFRQLADEFDARVREARAEQDRKANELAQRTETRRREFFASLNRIYAQVLRDTGAAAILDVRSVILADQTLDITPQIVGLLDRIHRGEQSPPELDEDGEAN